MWCFIFFVNLATQFLHGEEDLDSHDSLAHLPPLTTKEKLDKMDEKEKMEYLRKEMGSRASFRSDTSQRSGPSGSDDMKKQFD